LVGSLSRRLILMFSLMATFFTKLIVVFAFSHVCDEVHSDSSCTLRMNQGRDSYFSKSGTDPYVKFCTSEKGIGILKKYFLIFYYTLHHITPRASAVRHCDRPVPAEGRHSLTLFALNDFLYPVSSRSSFALSLNPSSLPWRLSNLKRFLLFLFRKVLTLLFTMVSFLGMGLYCLT